MNSRYHWRAYLVYLFLVLIVCGLIWRLIDLNLVNRFFLLKQSDARILRTETLVAHRGVITDREGTVLAMSTPVYSVWVNPKYFQATESQLTALSRSLALPVTLIKSRTNPANRKEFVYLKRQNSPDVMEAIKILNIPGV